MYIVNVLFPIVLYIIIFLCIRNRKFGWNLFFCVIFVYLVVFLSFFNYQTFPDVRTYNRHYEFLVTNSISDFYYFHGYILEIGYVFFIKLLALLSPDPRTLYIARGIIFSACILYVIRKYSKNYLLSILIFFICFGVNQSIFVVRQYLALAIFLLSISAILNKQPYKYLLIWFVAFSIHGSMIVFLPLYWIYNYLNISKLLILFWTIIAISISILVQNIFVFIAEKFGVYEAYLLFNDDEGTSAGLLLRTLMIFVPLLLFCFRKIRLETYGKLFFFTGLLNVCFGIAVIGIPSGGRLVTNYNAFSMLIVPYIFSSLQIKNTRYIYVCIILLIFYILYFLRLSDYGYYFVWQECDEYLPDTIEL